MEILADLETRDNVADEWRDFIRRAIYTASYNRDLARLFHALVEMDRLFKEYLRGETS